MITHESTATSEISYEDAISLALYAASDFLDNMTDAHVHIKDLREDENKHFCALLEITKDPLAPAYTVEEFEEDKHLGDHDADKKYAFYRRKGHASIRGLIKEHFKKKGQAVPSDIPDFIIAHLTATDIENNAIEKDFLFAAEAMPATIEPEMHVAKDEGVEAAQIIPGVIPPKNEPVVEDVPV